MIPGMNENDLNTVKNNLHQINNIDGTGLDTLKYSTMNNVLYPIFDVIADTYINQIKKTLTCRKNISFSFIEKIIDELDGFWLNNKSYWHNTDYSKVCVFFEKAMKSNDRWVMQYASILSFIYAPEKFKEFQQNLSKDDRYFVAYSLMSTILLKNKHILPHEFKTLENMALLATYIPGVINFYDIRALRKSEKSVKGFFEELQRKNLLKTGVCVAPPKKIKNPNDVVSHHKFWQGFNIEDSPTLLQKISPATLDKFIELGFDDFKNPELLKECSEDGYQLSTIERLFLYQNTPADEQIQHLIKYQTDKPCRHFMRLVVSAVTSGGDVNATDQNNENLLLNAGYAKDQKLFNWLLDNGADPNITTWDGVSAATEFPKYISDHQNKKIKKSLRGLKGCDTQKKVRKM